SNWGELAPRATRARLSALLAFHPPREQEALEALKAHCNPTALSSASPTCRQAYEAVLSHAAVLPPMTGDWPAGEGKKKFLLALPPPPESLGDLRQSYFLARSALFKLGLKRAASDVQSSLQAGEYEQALAMIDSSTRLLGEGREDPALAGE